VSLSILRTNHTGLKNRSQRNSNNHTFLFFQVIAATNRADILDPALMRSGRLDRKIEFPHPTEEARARILQVCLSHFSNMTLGDK